MYNLYESMSSMCSSRSGSVLINFDIFINFDLDRGGIRIGDEGLIFITGTQYIMGVDTI